MRREKITGEINFLHHGSKIRHCWTNSAVLMKCYSCKVVGDKHSLGTSHDCPRTMRVEGVWVIRKLTNNH